MWCFVGNFIEVSKRMQLRTHWSKQKFRCWCKHGTLTNDGSLQDLGVLTDNMTPAASAKIFNWNRTSIKNLCKFHQQTGSENDRPRPGAKSVTAMKHNRCIRLQQLHSRFLRITSTAPQKAERQRLHNRVKNAPTPCDQFEDQKTVL